ncbi:MAG: hypothetical protein JXQ90_17015 [Cyclobacteriaceae bacterium]
MGEFENELKRLEKRIAKHENQEDLIAFYGSSTVRLWVRMNRDLEPFNVINLGFGGSSFLDLNHQFGRLFSQVTPTKVVLYGGDNDLSQGFGPNDILREFRELTSRFRDKFPDIPIFSISIKPSPRREDLLDRVTETNNLLRAYLGALGNTYIIDVYHAMLDGQGNTRPELFLSDMLHLNREGYKIWAKEVSKLLF